MSADDIHAMCETLKARFDAGEIVALALVTLNTNRGVTTSVGGVEVDGIALVGALEVAKDRVKAAFKHDGAEAS